MARIGFALTGFVAGLSGSAGILLWLWTEFHSRTSEVWTASTEIRLENGTTIPAGSEFTVHRYMPEGFVTLRLSINVEGRALDQFESRVENVSFLVIPYWIAN